MYGDTGVEITLGANLAAGRGVVAQPRFIEAGGHEVGKGDATLAGNALCENFFELCVVGHGFLVTGFDENM